MSERLEQEFQEIGGVPVYFRDGVARRRIDALQGAQAVFTLEQSDNPEFDVSNIEVARTYINETGGYGMVVKNGQVYAAKLNRDGWDRFEDGTLVSAFPNGAADFETMAHFPDCYARGNGKTCRFGGLTNFAGAHKFGSPNWIGAYEMFVDGNGVGHSRPDVTPSHSKTMTAFWNHAQNLGPEFGLANYGFFCLVNALYQARYGNLNSQNVIGAGGQTGSWVLWRDVPMGLTRSLGDNDGNVHYNDGNVGDQYEVKLFSCEGLWGKLWEFRPGIRYEMRDGVRYAIIYDGNVVSNTAAGREVANILQSAGGQYAAEMVLGEYWDMICQAVGASEVTRYTDGYWAATGGELLLVGGYAVRFARCGLACSDSHYDFSISRSNIGARLAFYGNPKIVSGAELLALVS